MQRIKHKEVSDRAVKLLNVQASILFMVKGSTSIKNFKIKFEMIILSYFFQDGRKSNTICITKNM